ncbi:hypothetical protein MNBD_ALPHA06-329 [hydrothermal vent metagenome]|uniref:TonB-dependent receptor-like beta-barrel domain-containing protein n=1 Tax=hydrothermal vent metagenome TaxID=652676 RepID=A0A3B0RW75_9ZZZZ
MGLTDADFASTPFRRYAAAQLDQINAKHSELSARYRADLGAGFDLTVLAYQTRFSRDWFKLDRVNAAGSLVNSGKSGTGISAILDDPLTNANAFEVLEGNLGFVSADGALLIKHNNRDYVAKGLQAIIGWQGEFAGVSHNFETSVRYHQDEQDRFQWWDRYKVDNGTLVLTGSDTPGTESNRIDQARALAFYAQDQIKAGKWTFVPGLRFERVVLRRDEFGKNDPTRSGVNLAEKDNYISAFVPGLGVIYQANANWSLFGGVHRGFSPPGPGKTNTDAETARNWELGTRYANGALRLEATGFFNAFDNMIGTVTASTSGVGNIGDQFDAGKVDVMGLELSGEAELSDFTGTDFEMPVRFAYTYTRAEFQNSFASNFEPWGNVQAGDLVPYIPTHQFSGSLGVQTTRFGSELAVSIIGDVRTQAGQGNIPSNNLVAGRTILDASLWMQATASIKLSLSARNLTDKVYAAARRPAGLRPGLPRTFLFAVTFSY